MFRAVLFNNLYHDIIPNTIADRKARNNGKARLLKIEGNGAIENQLIINGDFVDTSNWESVRATFTCSNNVLTLNAVDINGYVQQRISYTANHVYLFGATAKSNDTTKNVNIEVYFNDLTKLKRARVNKTTYDLYCDIFTPTATTQNYDLFRFTSESQASDIANFKEGFIVDLTLEFGTGNEPTDVNDKRIKRILEKYRPHNTGTYNSTIIESVETKGFNIWDEEWELGQISSINGGNVASSSNIRSKNYIEVLPNTTYYIKQPKGYVLYLYDKDKNFIGYADRGGNTLYDIPNGVFFIRFVMYSTYGTTYNHDICINRSGERNGEYVPHRWQDFYQKVEYIEATGTQYMDTGINADSKLGVKFHALEVSGRFGAYARINNTDFRHHTYADMTKMYGFYQWGYEDIAGYGDHDVQVNWLNNKKLFDVKTQTEYDVSGANFDLLENYYLFARNSDSVSYWTGKLYHLSMSVETTIVRDFIPVYRKQDGTIGLYDLVEGKFYVNQGTGTFLKGADVPNHNAIKLPAPLQLDGAINSRNSFEITKNGYVFTRNVWYVDLGTLTWNASSDGVNTFYGDVGNVKRVSNNDTIANIMCPKYCSVTRNAVSGINKAVSVNINASFHVHDTDYNNPTAFKTAMAGVPIYYELATPQVITIPRKHLRAVKIKDISSLTFHSVSSAYSEFFDGYMPNDCIAGTDPTIVQNIWCSQFITIASGAIAVGSTDMRIALAHNTQRIIFCDYSVHNVNDFLAKHGEDVIFYEAQDEVEDFVNEELYQRGGEINGYKPTLPSEYERVEYLQSSGTQWIDTGVSNISVNAKAIIYGEFQSGANMFGNCAYTTPDSSSGGLLFMFSTSSGASSFGKGVNNVFVNSTKDQLGMSGILGTKYKVELNKNGIFVDDTKKLDWSETPTQMINDYNLRLFGGYGAYNTPIAKLCYFKLYDNDKLVRDFIPAVRKSDNVAGLYDMVTRQFFTNQGTGTFAVGGYIERPHETCEVLPNVEVSLQCK